MKWATLKLMRYGRLECHHVGKYQILKIACKFGYTWMINNYFIYFRVCRDQWIRAKYERKEFTIEAKDSDKQYLSGML